MTSGVTLLDVASVLAGARRARADADEAEVRVLAAALDWAHLHEVTDPDHAATWGNTPVALTGDGAPLVGEFCIPEFAAALGLSTDAGKSLIAHAVELAHRLPRLWARITTGTLQVWRARRIAERTLTLTAEAAAYVDTAVAPYAHRVGPTRTEHLVDEAIARYMPETAEEIAARAAEGRHVTIRHTQVSYAGTSWLHAELDLADALDLEAALARGAEALKEAGSEQPLDIRRAMALGALARGDDVAAPRQAMLYVHLTPGSPTGWLENRGPHPVTKTQITDWLDLPGAQVTVRPVIDLNEPITTLGYSPSDRLTEQTIVRDRTCVFPWCTRPARGCDRDHTTPYDAVGAPGQTTSANLANLCRRHHRLKTFSGWTYTELEPGTYLWRSPHGYQYLRDPSGTESVSAPPLREVPPARSGSHQPGSGLPAWPPGTR